MWRLVLPFPVFAAVALGQRSAAEQELLRLLQEGTPRSLAAAVERWRALPDGGLAHLPTVLATFVKQHDMRVLTEPLRALHPAHAAEVEAALTDAVLQGATPGLLRVVGTVAPAVCAGDRVVRHLAQADPLARVEGVHQLGAGAARGVLGIEPLLALLELSPVELHGNLLTALHSIPGSWRTRLWPKYGPLLDTQLAAQLVGLFVPVRAELPQFVASLRDLLGRRASDALLRVLCYAIAFEPDLAAELLPELERALARAGPEGTAMVLFALAHVAPPAGSLGPLRERVLACLRGDGGEIATAALACTAAWRLDGDDVVAAIVEAARSRDEATCRTARWLAFCLRPREHAAPPPLRRGHDPIADFACATAAWHAAEPLPAATARSLLEFVPNADPCVATAALAAAQRSGVDVVQAAANVAQHLQPLEGARLHWFADRLLALGPAGWRALAAQLVQSGSRASWLEWIAQQGEAALPVWVAVAAELGTRPDVFPVPSPLAALDAADLARLPPAARDAVRDPHALLRRVLEDERRDETLRGIALRALLGGDAAGSIDLARLVLAGRGEELRAAGARHLLQTGDGADPEFVGFAVQALAVPAVRAIAVQALRRLGPAAHDALAAAWLGGDLPVRSLAGVLVRERFRDALPPMPPALASAVPTEDPTVRLAVACALAAGNDAGPALELLREHAGGGAPGTAADANAVAHEVAMLATALAQGGADLAPHVEVFERLLRMPSQFPVPALLRALGRAGDGGREAIVRAVALPHVRARLRQDRDLPGEVLLALLEIAPTLPERERTGLVEVATAGASRLCPLPAAADAARRAWLEADSWTDRARLVPLIVELQVPLAFVVGDVARMLADPRPEVAGAGRRLELLVADDATLEALRVRFVGAAPAERLATLRAVATLPDLPAWIGAHDLLVLAGELTLPELLAVCDRWRPAPGDPDRAALAEWLLGRLARDPRPDDAAIDRAAATLLRLRDETADLLAQQGGARVAVLQPLVFALGRRDATFVHSLLARVADAQEVVVLRAIGLGSAPALLPVLEPLVRDGPLQHRVNALLALPATGPAGLQLHLSLLDEPDLGVHALQALACWGPRAAPAIPELLACAQRDDIGRVQVPEVLAAMGPRGFVALEELARAGIDVTAQVWRSLASRDEATVVAALRTLGTVLPPDADAADRLAAAPLGADTQRTRTWRDVVAAALRGQALPGAAAVLRGLAADDPALRRQSVLALRRLDPPPFGTAQLLVEALWDADATVRLAAATELRAVAAATAAAARAIAERLAVETDPAVAAALRAR